MPVDFTFPEVSVVSEHRYRLGIVTTILFAFDEETVIETSIMMPFREKRKPFDERNLVRAALKVLIDSDKFIDNIVRKAEL